MADHVHLEYVVEGDNFVSAGSATESVKACLKGMGVKPEDVRRVAISMYEGEINMVIHANGGKATADKMPMISTTTNNSISEKPFYKFSPFCSNF